MSKNIQDTLANRQKTHGNYFEHAAITQTLKDTMRGQPGWSRCNLSQRETLDMIAHKIGRILAGDPKHDDHWRDIAGYVQLIVNQLNEKNITQSPQEQAQANAQLNIPPSLTSGQGTIFPRTPYRL